ncbi:MAG: 16S rRNA (guanine(527)-N(7))-methyltransferase RsmG [Phycisphaerales bacterium]|nr:16S rRNA (guanine(527)-N(7))-methyltransferase RsmG [Phycisphaerales bacterium]
MTTERASQGGGSGPSGGRHGDSIRFAFDEIKALAPAPSFDALCAGFGIALEAAEVEALGLLLAMVIEGNRHLNLTAITDDEGMWDKHAFDSLTPLAVLSELPEGSDVIDVGSGAGFPGLPLAIVCPHLRFTMLEATAKKCAFMHAAAERLGLLNVRVVQARAEAAGQDRSDTGHRERYQGVLARAVGRTPTLAELTVPLCAKGGVIVLIKGEKADEELAEAQHALRELRAVHEMTIPTPTGRLVVLRKGALTPKIYPRRDGEPKSRPLLGR